MRPTTRTLIVTFESTTQAMRMERFCLEHHLPGRLIPLPTQLSAGCGLAWKTSPDQLDSLMEELRKHGLSWEKMAMIDI